MVNQLDVIFSQLGTGKWNLIHYFTVGYAVGLPTPHALAGAFVAPRLKYNCHLPPDAEPTSLYSNHTRENACSYSIRTQDGDFLEEEDCSHWDYDNSTFTNTITSEFDLVCEREYFRATYQSMYMIGVMVGAPINGILADRYGRKFTFVSACLLFMVVANTSCWLPNIPSLLAFRFILGLMHTSILKTGFILAMEITDPKMRSVVGIAVFLPWGLGTMLWGGLAYLERSWRYLMMFGSVPWLLIVPALWFMDESPRWLLVRGQHQRALQILKKAATWNCVSLPPDEEIVNLLKDGSEVIKEVSVSKMSQSSADWKYTIREYVADALVLFRTPRIRIASIVFHLDCFVLGMVYFGLSLSGGNFNFNVFSYMALMGLAEIPAYTVMAPIVSRFGRQMPVSSCYLSTGVVLLALPFIPSSIQWLEVTFALIGKMTISMAFQGSNVYFSELFPTEVRTRAVSSAFMFSRIGSSLSPFITEYLSVVYPWVPSVVFGCAATVAGLATLVLWETLGLAMPDTVAQLENPDFKPTKRYFKKISAIIYMHPQSESKATRV